MALLILGYPDYLNSIANKTIVEQLNTDISDLEIRNIQELYSDFRIDVKSEQRALLRHQTVIFQYPFYWYGMPAILKHWFDTVFEYQFAFGSRGDKLKNKNFLASFTVGGKERDYRTLEKHHFRVEEFCKNLEQIAYFAQMNYIDPMYMYNTSLVDGFTKSQIESAATVYTNKLLIKLADIDKYAANVMSD